MSDWQNDPKFLELRAEVKRRGVDNLLRGFDGMADLYSASESPIENLMLHALLLTEVPLYFQGDPHPLVDPTIRLVPPERKITVDEFLEKNEDIVLLFQQQKIENYRVDFLIGARFMGRKPHKIVIECDGHQFHERTKEQAERDRSRDRELTLLGYHVMRFTGREIWRDPISCAAQVGKLLENHQFEDCQS